MSSTYISLFHLHKNNNTKVWNNIHLETPFTNEYLVSNKCSRLTSYNNIKLMDLNHYYMSLASQYLFYLSLYQYIWSDIVK